LAQFEAWKETKTLEALETEKASYVAPKTTARSTAAKAYCELSESKNGV
jgi:hypothetical protein